MFLNRTVGLFAPQRVEVREEIIDASVTKTISAPERVPTAEIKIWGMGGGSGGYKGENGSKGINSTSETGGGSNGTAGGIGVATNIAGVWQYVGGGDGAGGQGLGGIGGYSGAGGAGGRAGHRGQQASGNAIYYDTKANYNSVVITKQNFTIAASIGNGGTGEKVSTSTPPAAGSASSITIDSNIVFTYAGASPQKMGFVEEGLPGGSGAPPVFDWASRVGAPAGKNRGVGVGGPGNSSPGSGGVGGQSTSYYGGVLVNGKLYGAGGKGGQGGTGGLGAAGPTGGVGVGGGGGGGLVNPNTTFQSDGGIGWTGGGGSGSNNGGRGGFGGSSYNGKSGGAGGFGYFEGDNYYGYGYHRIYHLDYGGGGGGAGPNYNGFAGGNGINDQGSYYGTNGIYGGNGGAGTEGSGAGGNGGRGGFNGNVNYGDWVKAGGGGVAGGVAGTTNIGASGLPGKDGEDGLPGVIIINYKIYR